MFAVITQEFSKNLPLVLALLSRNCRLRKPFKQLFLPFLSAFFFTLHFVTQKLCKKFEILKFYLKWQTNIWIQILEMQQCKLIILSNFYCIHSCCLNLFSCQICFFVCIYYSSCMHICILLYIHVTVLYYILASFQKIKMLMLMFNETNIPPC